MAAATKKRPVKKKAASPKTETAVKKTVHKKTVSKAPKVTKTKEKTTEAPKRGGFVDRDLDALGFVPGSDSSIIAHALVEGGGSRSEVIDAATAAIEKSSGLQTRSGKDKYVPSMTSGVLKRLLETGCTVESSFKVVPPAEIRKRMANEKRKKARRK